MRLLVASAERLRAGKTTFSVGLVERTDAIGFKPRAGNDYWHHHDQYRRTVTEGRLYGKDADRLARASATDVDPEDINAIHRLWRPRPGRGTGLLGQEGRDFVIDRVGESFVVNGTVEVPDLAREHLPLDGATEVEDLRSLNEVMAENHLRVQQDLADEVRSADRAVVESYAETARPLTGLEPDAVAVVEPTRARIYDGDRYVKGCAVASGGPSEGQLEERAGEVIDLIEPKATVSLPPLTDEERDRPDRIAEAYDHAYDRVLAVAFE